MIEQERLQLLERFGMDSKIWPEHLNAIVEEILSLRNRVAELEVSDFHFPVEPFDPTRVYMGQAGFVNLLREVWTAGYEAAVSDTTGDELATVGFDRWVAERFGRELVTEDPPSKPKP